MNALTQHAAIAWKLGTRSHAIKALLILGLLLLLIAFLAGAFSLRQPLVVTMDVGISGVRLLTALLTLFWMQETFMRDLERRTITLAFSLPVERSAYVLGRFFGVMVMISVAVVCWSAALAAADQFSTWGYAQSSRPFLNLHYLYLLVGIMLDAWVIGAFVLAITSVAETPLLPFLVGAAFALAARSIGPVLDYLAFSTQTDPELSAHFLPLINTLRWLLPDLSMLDWRDPVLYGQAFPWQKACVGLALALAYITLCLLFATRAYNKRELS